LKHLLGSIFSLVLNGFPIIAEAAGNPKLPAYSEKYYLKFPIDLNSSNSPAKTLLFTIFYPFNNRLTYYNLSND
jgi:hypothetical protein